ncbi:unnamed protein product [Parajaminaea phylloscopi]
MTSRTHDITDVKNCEGLQGRNLRNLTPLFLPPLVRPSSDHLPTIGAYLSTPKYSALNEERKMAAKQAAERLISQNFVAVFSKTYCPYCVQAKSVVNKLSLPAGGKVGIMELDRESGGSDVQAYLLEKTGQTTVPSIFIQGKHLGGCSDLLSAKSSGKLDELIKN